MAELALLFASAFLAATILPFASEITLAGMAMAGWGERLTLWAVATTGNTLGSLVNWALGRWARRWRDHHRFPLQPEQLERATRHFRRWGIWSLLFAWVPIVGDPLTLVAGLFRTPLLPTMILIAIGKGARYAVVLGLVPA